jgi:D-alanyl-D-alanine carboxypeptidase
LTKRRHFRSLVGLLLVTGVAVGWFGLLTVPPPAPVQGIAVEASNASAVAPGSIAPATASATDAAPSLPLPSPADSPQAEPTPPSTTRPTAIVPSAAPATIEALNTRLRTLRTTYGLPGVSAAILFADGTMWRATSGFADVKAKRRLTQDTEFAIASISKTFLAALTLKLSEEGSLDIEAPVVRYLPDLALDPTITVHQLLDHTSGLHDYFYAPDIDDALLADRRRVWTTQEALSYVGKPYFPPGTGWHYSNTNYLILGLLAETVGGAPLPDQFRTRFLAPLGMARTHYQSLEEPRGPVARGYRFNGPSARLPPIPLSDGTSVVPFTSVVTAAGSAGSMASTARDLAIWARALYGGSVLETTSFDRMVAEVTATAPFKPSIPYGLGVQAATIDGRPTLGHSGRLLGSRTVVRWLPQQGIAIAVLTNQSRNDPNLVARALLRVVLGAPPPCEACPTPN